jgi:hypothetical protein
MKQQFVQNFQKPFMLLIRERGIDSAIFKTRKTTLVGEFEEKNVNKIFDYVFPPSEYLQRAISGKIPDFVATLRAFEAGALIFEKTAYFDKL